MMRSFALFSALLLFVCPERAATCGAAPAHSTQAPPTTASAVSGQDVRMLAPGQPIERELAGGETHFYSTLAGGGAYLRVVVEQRSVDVSLALIGADGRLLAETDSFIGVFNQQRLSFVTEA